MKELVALTNSVWLMANLFVDGQIIGNLPKSHILEHKGLKIGLFGLCEWEWIGLLCPSTVTEELHYVDFVQTAKEMSKLLKEQGCDYIIALTHMRLPNDRILAEKCQGEVDLILGGHDHSSVFEKIGSVSIVKSGTDFEEFSDIKVDL